MTQTTTPRDLLSPDDSAVLLCDHQPLVALPTEGDRLALAQNAAMLAGAAVAFGAPLILTTIRAAERGGLIDAVRAAAPDVAVIDRPAHHNALDAPHVRAALEATGRRRVVLAGAWAEVCVTFTALALLRESYEVHVAADACTGTTLAAHDLALTRLWGAGAVPTSAVQVSREYVDAREDAGAYRALHDLHGRHTGTLGLVWAVPGAPQATSAPTPGDAEAEILRLTDDWPRALVERDAAALERIVAGGDLTFIEPDGSFQDRGAYLASRTSGGGSMTGVDYTYRRVRVFGDVAILTGRSVVHERQGGGDAQRHYAVTDVFVRENGAWHAVTTQMTPADADPAFGGSVLNPVSFQVGGAPA